MNPKKNLEKLEETEVAWETNAAADLFYGTTLIQFKAKVQLSRDARALVASLEQQLTAATAERNRLDAENLGLEKNVAKAIAGDPNHGDNSALYEGTGRVRRSERRSGLTRKKKIKENNDG